MAVVTAKELQPYLAKMLTACANEADVHRRPAIEGLCGCGRALPCEPAGEIAGRAAHFQRRLDALGPVQTAAELGAVLDARPRPPLARPYVFRRRVN